MALANGNKWLRREKVRESPVVQGLMTAAEKRLKTDGYFSKQDVLEDTNMVIVGPSIRWDYLMEFLEEDYAIKLLKVAARFFQTYDKDTHGNRVRTEEDRQINPSKYLATGHGKKTAGYVLAEIDDGKLAIKVLMNKRGIAVGTQVAASKMQTDLTRRNLIGRDKMKKLPAPKKKKKAAAKRR